MELYLNTILNLTNKEIENSKIEFNMQAGSGGQPFLDRWLKHSEMEKATGTYGRYADAVKYIDPRQE